MSDAVAEADLKPCPDCAVAVGTPHEDGCDVARCLNDGGQRLQCDGVGPVLKLLDAIERIGTWPEIMELAVEARDFLGDDAHDCGEDVWTGHWPGEVECIEFGFWCTDPRHPPMRPCPAGTPNAAPDLNRLLTETQWDREQKRWVLR